MAAFNLPPNQPQPPMVNAGAPVGTPDIVGALRGQQRIGERSRKNQEMWQGLQGQFGAPTTQGPIQHLDWGNILGRGASAYMAAKEGKKAEVAEDSADAMQRTFFNSIMQDDPKGQQLVQMAQMGVPGSDKALGAYLSPKKEALAGFIQGITSGALAPEMAAELAPRYGLTAETASAAAAYAKKQMEEQQGQEADLRKELMGMQVQGRLDAAGIAAEAKAAGKGPDHVPAATVNLRNKEMLELDKELQNLQSTNFKFEDITKRLESDTDSFSSKWGLTEALGQWENPMAQFAAKRLMSPLQVELSNVVMDETLNQLARLSGAMSNYEMEQIKKGLPNALLNKEAAMAMMKKLNEWRNASIGAVKLKRMYLKTYGFMDQSAEDIDFYSMAKSGVTPEEFGAKMEAQRNQTNRPQQSGGTLQQFMDEAAEMGF